MMSEIVDGMLENGYVFATLDGFEAECALTMHHPCRCRPRKKAVNGHVPCTELSLTQQSHMTLHVMEIDKIARGTWL